jgi:hypothetical protein
MKYRSSEKNLSSPSGWVRQAWTTTPADVDIITVGPGYIAGEQGYMCKQIYVVTAGTLVYTDVAGADHTLTCGANEMLPIECIGLKSTSTAQGVKVYW